MSAQTNDETSAFRALLEQALNGHYEVMIDARSEGEYAEDHIPGAINLPVVDDDEYAQVGTIHRQDKHRAYLIGVSHALRNISNAIDQVVARYPINARILVYCFRGGKRSKLWFDALSTIGYKVDRLPGGWKAYRAWVREELARTSGRFRYHVLCGPTGCGKTRLLSALAHVGAQVLDLEELARHRGSLIGSLPGIPQPSQKWFDSLLFERMRQFDPALPVWVESESKKIGAIELPSGLLAAMHAGRTYAISADMSERVALWREDYGHFEREPQALIDRLRHLRPLIGNEEFSSWQSLANEVRMPQLFERIMERHYDPAYARSIGKNYRRYEEAIALKLASLAPDALVEVAAELHGKQPHFGRARAAS